MTTPHAANQEQVGSQLYFFRSPNAGTTDCLIMGHAGWVPTLREKTEFRVPANLTLHFRTFDGEANLSDINAELFTRRANYQPSLGSSIRYENITASRGNRGKVESLLVDKHDKDRTRFVGGEMCKNYVVMKGVGYHWDQANPDNSSYTAIASQIAAANWQPHFVSVRNRLWPGSTYIMLEDIITKVSQHCARITTFYMAGCRGIEPHWTPKGKERIDIATQERMRDFANGLARNERQAVAANRRFTVQIPDRNPRELPQTFLTDAGVSEIARQFRASKGDVIAILKASQLTRKLVPSDDEQKTIKQHQGIRTPR